MSGDSSLRSDGVLALRRLGACVASGIVVGVAVGGIGSRLAMMLLARLNPEVTGLISDDGFRMGQFTVGDTLNLILFAGVLLGLVGGAIYAVLRHLVIGPRWFQLASMSIGAGVVTGAVIVHSDGVDFQLLDPLWLAVGLFVLIPALYVACLMWLADRWLRPESWWYRAHPALAIAPALLVAPVFPLAIGLVVGWLLLRVAPRDPATGEIVMHDGGAWIFRAGLTAIFTMAVVDLVGDIADLT